MKNEDKISHTRYYIFRHDKGENVRYRTPQGNWSPEFTDAAYWPDREFVRNKATNLVLTLGIKDTIVIGKVIISVDGLFPMEVINANR